MFPMAASADATYPTAGRDAGTPPARAAALAAQWLHVCPGLCEERARQLPSDLHALPQTFFSHMVLTKWFSTCGCDPFGAPMTLSQG